MQAPQPVHWNGSIFALPSTMEMAFTGQTCTHASHPLHKSAITNAFSGLVVTYSLLRKSAALAAAPKASETVSRTSFGLRVQPQAKIPVTSESTGSSLGCFSVMKPSSPMATFILSASSLSPAGGTMGMAKATMSYSSSLVSPVNVSSAKTTSLPFSLFL